MTAALFGGITWLVLASGTAKAQSGDAPAEPAASDPAPAPDPAAAAEPMHEPFTLYAADPQPIAYEELDAIEKARTDAAGEWAETQSGESVHQAWAAVSAQMAHDGEVQRAERAAGVNGLVDQGVQ